MFDNDFDKFPPTPGKEWKEISQEELVRKIEDMRKQAEASAIIPDTMVMDDELFMYLMMHRQIEERDKQFYYNGLLVMTSSKVPNGWVYLTKRENALRFLGENDQGESEPNDPYPNGKPEPKLYHCPICGTRYYDKGDAKQCRRSHEWQNRRGRR